MNKEMTEKLVKNALQFAATILFDTMKTLELKKFIKCTVDFDGEKYELEFKKKEE